MTQFSPGALNSALDALSRHTTHEAPLGGSAVGDIFGRGAFSGAAKAAGDIAGVFDAVGEKVGVDLWDDRWLEGDLLDGVVRRNSDGEVSHIGEELVSEAVRFGIEEYITRGALRGGTTKALTGFGLAKAGSAAQVAKSSSVLTNLGRLLKGGEGVSRGVESLKLAETATAYGLIGLAQSRGDIGDDSVLGYSAKKAGEFVALDAVFGLGLKGIGIAGKAAGKFAVPYIRGSWVGRYLDKQVLEAAAQADRKTAEHLNTLFDASDDALREMASNGRAPKDLVDQIISKKYTLGPDAFNHGAERDRVVSELSQSLTGADAATTDAITGVLAIHDAVGRMHTLAGKSINSLDDYYRTISFKGGTDAELALRQVLRQEPALTGGVDGTPADAVAGSGADGGAGSTRSGVRAFHLSAEDLSGVGIHTNRARVRSFNSESKYYNVDGEGKVTNGVVHFYLPDRKPEIGVLQGSEVLHELDLKINPIYNDSPEMFEIVKGLRERGEHRGSDNIWREVKKAGYDAIIDRDWKQGQLLRDAAPAEIAKAERLTPERARGLSPRGPDILLQVKPTAPILSGDEVLKVKATGERGQPTLVDIATALNNRQRAVSKFKPGNHTPKAFADLVESLKIEARTALSNSDTAKGIGWYSGQVSEMLETVAKIHPEIAADGRSNFVFRLLLATTSNGNSPDLNMRSAVQLFEQWQKTGKLVGPVRPIGMRASGIESTLSRVQSMIESAGGDEEAYRTVALFFNSNLTAREIAQATGRRVPQEAADAVLQGSMTLGPKIGAFFANLGGEFKFPTLDSWMYRQFNRIRGSLVEGGELAQTPRSAGEQKFFREAMIAAADDLSKETKNALTVADLQAILWYHEKALYEKLGIRGAAAERQNFASAARKVQQERAQGTLFQRKDVAGQQDLFGGTADEAVGAAPDAPSGEAAGLESAAAPVADDAAQAVTDSARGAVTFRDGQAMVFLFSSADPSTLFHESAHIFRRLLPELSAELAETANKWVGAADSNWTVEQEEQWALAFEKYLADGQAPTRELDSVFEMAKAWMLDVYRNVINSPLEMPLSPEIKEVFDLMLGGVTRPATAADSSLAAAMASGVKGGLSATDALTQGAKKTLNYKHLDTTDSALDLVKADSEAILKAVDNNVDNTQSIKMWVDHANSIGAEDAGPLLASAEPSVRLIGAKIIAGKQRLVGLFEEADELIARLEELEAAGNLGTEYKMLEAQIDGRLDAARRLGALTYSIQREVARGTTAGNARIVGKRLTGDDAKRILRLVDSQDPESATLKTLVEREADADGTAVERGLDELDAGPEPQTSTKGGPAKTAASPEGKPGDTGTAQDVADAGPPSGAGAAPEAPPAGANGRPGPSGGPAGTAPAGGAEPSGPPAMSRAKRRLYTRIRQAVSAGQAHQVPKITQAARQSKMGAIMELWTSLLLSGMKTLSANTIGNAVNTAFQPLAKAAGELVQLRPNPRGSLEALSLYGHTVSSLMDMWNATRIHGGGFQGFRAVAKSLAMETSIFERNIEGLRGPSFRARTFGLQNKSLGGAAVNVVGKAVRAPGLRLLSATDELFTNLNYIAMVRFEATKSGRELIEQGVLRPDQLGVHIDSAVQAAFEKGGAAADNTGAPVFQAAYNYAKDAGFKTPLEFGIGKLLKEAKQHHPWVGFIAPFITTPVNIFRSAIRTSPLGFIQNAVERSRLNLTPDQIVRRRGEFILGTALWGMVGYWALNGRMTGGGPRNLEERKLLQATGWQPYSFVVEGEDGKPQYVAFSRIEPLGSTMSIAADAAELYAHSNEHEWNDIVLLLTESFLRNATNKTYVTGLSDFFRVMTEPSYAGKWAQRMVATAVVPPAVAQFTSSTDDELHEARTILEGIRRRTPGMSDTLPPRRNILGEPITPPGGYVPFVDVADPLHREMLPRMLSPAALSRRSSDPVINELAALRHGILQPQRSIEGLDLTMVRTEKGQEAYDRWIELTGTVAPGGVDLHKALGMVVGSKAYQSLPQAPFDPTDTFNPRRDAVMRVLSRYRAVAKRQLVAETPALRQHLIDTAESRVGKMTASEALLERLQH